MQRSDAVDGFRLAYDDHTPHGSPEAAAVVLLHGWPGDRRDFRDVVPLLTSRCRVVVPDLRGFGDSEMPDGTAPADYAAAAAWLSDVLGGTTG